MTQYFEIPLTPRPQKFNITLVGQRYQFVVHWADMGGTGWVIDISDADGNPLLAGAPLVTGTDLLAQYEYLGLGGSLFVYSEGQADAAPTFGNLGVGSHLLFAVPEVPVALPAPVATPPLFPAPPSLPSSFAAARPIIVPPPPAVVPQDATIRLGGFGLRINTVSLSTVRAQKQATLVGVSANSRVGILGVVVPAGQATLAAGPMATTLGSLAVSIGTGATETTLFDGSGGILTDGSGGQLTAPVPSTAPVAVSLTGLVMTLRVGSLTTTSTGGLAPSPPPVPPPPLPPPPG